MTEAELQRYVLEAAVLAGWLAYHTHDSRRSQPGFPDLVLVRRPRMIYAELKSDRGRLRAEQNIWLAELRAVAAEVNSLGRRLMQVVVWTPEQWSDGSIVRELR
jgi:hypothetical protein